MDKKFFLLDFIWFDLIFSLTRVKEKNNSPSSASSSSSSPPSHEFMPPKSLMSMSLDKSRESMEVKEVLHMSRGDGENSYAKASIYTQKVALVTKRMIASAVNSLLEEPFFPCELLNVVDLGCSSGPSTSTFISTVIETIESNCRGLGSTLPEVQFYLNDLPGNDFNTLFKNLSEFRRNFEGLSFFLMGAPGSFHERIFPQASLHLAHSSYSAQWLSQFPQLMTEGGSPLNKGKIYISKTSPPKVMEAYLAQFQEDCTNFLSCRSKEMVIGARLVLVLHVRNSADPASDESCYPWESLAEAISSLVSEGLVEEEKLDTLNMPYYTASQEELQQIVQQEGSFTMEHIETFALDIGGPSSGGEDPWISGKKHAKNVRSYTESILQHYLGEEVMDKLYDEKLAYLIGEYLVKEQIKGTNLVVILRKHS
ncbi:probable caffeine synthase 2 isoform X2 [Punica granatum]|uniref:Uncharacterized protein n=2 Tax=Punica granatum TaxID=22663 RepID=A0A218XS09_PUNGR|nr:probable caffeine synthase 2 isoform X2 [Punica granatum]OWM87436.1 hypothetical protein CDL15_Pgr022547 [Punica granatum]PKI46647.1 hypothetical protein CRG98_032989 [Punica granatum]